LDADGMPENLIEEGLKQPDWIKISFKKGAKEITGHAAPDQAQFGGEYFIGYTLPNFKSKMLIQLLDMQKDNGSLLFSLMGQCFQDVGLTKWTSVIAKQCPNNADYTKTNFDECIRYYLEAVASVPNVGNQLICWLHTAKKPALMMMQEFMWPQVQLLSYLEGGYLHWMMEVPMAQEKSEQKSSSCSTRRTRTSLQTWTRWCLPTRSRWLLSLSRVKQPTSHLAFLRRLPRIRSSWRERKWLIFLLHVAVNQATGSIVVVNIATTIKATNGIMAITDLTIITKTIDTTIALESMTMTQRAPSPMTRRMIASAITPRKRAMRPCIVTSPLHWAWGICPEEGVVLVQDLLHALILGLALAQAAGAMTSTMWLKMTAGRLRPSSADIHTPQRVTTLDVSIALIRAIPFLPPSLLQLQRKESTPRNRELHQ
jgi:hypothetical protein